MKISKIKIENFRSIKSTEFKTDNFNIVVGQNNCGKTNFFEAVEFFFNGAGRGGLSNDLKFKRQSDLEILVEIEFSGAQNGADKMRHEGNKTKILNVLGESDFVTISRNSTTPNKRKVFVNGAEVNPGTGFDAALNDFLPKFEYINTKQYYDSVAKYGKTTPIGIMLSGVLSAILESNQQYQDFQNKFKELFEGDDSEIKTQFDLIGGKVKVNLEKQFPDTSKVNFEVTAPVFDDLLKNFETTVDDGIETSAEEKGDGMQRALMLAIIQTFAEFRKESEDEGKSFLFFIDEAELHLHPTAQRNLKNVLHELSESTDQVFINTHSSVFVADNYPNQKIFKAEKNEGATEIEPTDDLSKPYIVFELLGGSPSDLLLPRNFLIVEGLSEFEFLTRVIRRFYSDRPKIQIIKANGDIDQAERTINAIEKAFTPLNTSIYNTKQVILIDTPSAQTQGGVTDFLQRNPELNRNNQFFQIPHRDLEQYYPNQVDATYGNWKKTQAELDAVNETDKKTFTGKKKRQLAKHVGDNISQAQFENEMPIVFETLRRVWELAY
ncbi:Predicted ATP-dependent endonuclease of the OLD family, contains P-loop ATPase and TOPRIM domains [Algoriphagus locisalis]|uniref:Predicted ATP-dependent endonuclease of the OLD family, contains P-loop ATPase and TOPRIM domains n=2 Tax=Algoriphagus locisalis TaxID=305507 RepID=A0A1I7A9N1_9BACT|nr:Predicted ATP-dependent endonuclease of the OLD family, contains P-loop ATPase and TOPRIM domains [Algoriphagus locisalis]